MLFRNITYDIACIVSIIYFTRYMYLLSYGKVATRYLDNQLSIIGASSISCTLVLNIYYYFNKIYSIDTNGLLLAITLMIGGLISNFIYKHFFRLKSSIFQPTNEEYLFMTSIAFLSISAKMVIHDSISFTIPLTLLLGRYVWLDTRSIKEIKENLKTNHKRVVESSIILLLGLVLPSLIVSLLHIPQFYEIIFSLCYGFILLIPYRYIRKLIKIK